MNTTPIRAALLLASLSLSACTTTASVLARSSMQPITTAACTVTEIGHDRPNRDAPPRQSRWVFDARGALVEHEYNPEYHSRARVLYRRDARSKLLSIDYQYDRQAEDFPCASVQGCDMPAVHARGRVELDYEGDRVIRRTDARSPGRLVIDTFSYNAQGQLSEHRSESGAERFEYQGALLRRREWNFHHGHGDELFVYDGSRLTEVQRMMCGSICGERQSRRLSYNAQGLLERITHPEGSTDTWTYDAQGRMTARGDGQQTRAWYRYDEQGRVTAWGQGESPLREYRYDGACGQSAAINRAIVGKPSDYSERDESQWAPVFP